MGLIAQAFDGDRSLYQRILLAIEKDNSSQQLFNDIAAYHLRHTQSASSNSQPGRTTADDEPASKKRKLANGSVPIRSADAQSETIVEMREVSFSIPQRKKLHLRIVQYISTNTTQPSLGVQAVNPADNKVEYEIPLSDIAHVLRTPVPEKATKQYNYIFLPSPTSTCEPILFTTPATPPKGGTYTFPSDTTNLEDALAAVLQPHNLTLTLPDDKEFASATPESHRKTEKAYHVKAFRGSKDGFLFFLSTGIFFGFKKPLLFLGLEEIESISYTSVLQRTFNLNIAYRKVDADGSEATEEIEFSMLDQSDHGGINEYIQRHGLNDASLAASRRAKSQGKKKAAAANGAEGGDAATGEDEEDDGRTELEKAEAELQDEEDELEEDFEPSDEDDDGSGSEDESADGNGAGAGAAAGRSRRNLVEDELGSEAEDVEMSDAEENEGDEQEEGDEVDNEEGEEQEEEEEEEEEEIVEAPKPKAAAAAPQPAAAQGRWGAAINNNYNIEPDPSDDDQL